MEKQTAKLQLPATTFELASVMLSAFGHLHHEVEDKTIVLHDGERRMTVVMTDDSPYTAHVDFDGYSADEAQQLLTTYIYSLFSMTTS